MLYILLGAAEWILGACTICKSTRPRIICFKTTPQTRFTRGSASPLPRIHWYATKGAYMVSKEIQGHTNKKKMDTCLYNFQSRDINSIYFHHQLMQQVQLHLSTFKESHMVQKLIRKCNMKVLQDLRKFIMTNNVIYKEIFKYVSKKHKYSSKEGKFLWRSSTHHKNTNETHSLTWSYFCSLHLNLILPSHNCPKNSRTKYSSLHSRKLKKKTSWAAH